MRKSVAWTALAVVCLVAIGGGVKALSDLAVEDARKSAYSDGRVAGYVLGSDATLRAFEEGCNLVYTDGRATTTEEPARQFEEIIADPACSHEHVEMWNGARGDGEPTALAMRPRSERMNVFKKNERLPACVVERLEDGCTYFSMKPEEWAR